MNARTVFFVGKPGCGKGTQAKMLAEKTGWPIISAGAQFRAISAEDTPLGRKVKLENEAGMLAPHWLAMYLYLKALFALPADANVIFDGFNRKVPEAELILSSLAWLERPFIIVYLRVSDELVRARLDGRKKTSGRVDDNVVDERLKEYYMHTDPAIEIFRNAGVLLEVDGEKDPAEIAAHISVALGI